MLPQMLFLLLPGLSAQQAPQAPGPLARPVGALEPAPMLQVARDAVEHTMAALGDQDEPPYHLAIGVTQSHSLHLSATNGAMMVQREDWNRYADLDLRVGSYALDNTHKLLDAGWFSEEGRSVVRLPIGDGASDMQAAELTLWRELDDSYQQAVRRMTKVRANQAVKVARDDPSDDFSSAPKVVDIRPVQDVELNAAWEDSLRQISTVFLEYPEVLESGVEVTAEAETFLLANSEGTQLQHTRVRYRASVHAVSLAEDGARLAVYDYLDASTEDGLPSPEVLSEMARIAAQRVTDLKNAPLLEPYTGPAILRGRAAGVFFHEIFGHRVEGHRQKDEDEGQTFTDMVGEQVLPDFLSVVDDPTIRSLAGLDLNGTYPYDDEGVLAQRVALVDHGELLGFLMSRAPIEGIDSSNGHGRRQPGNAIVARQGNLIVQAHESVSFEELRAGLIQQVEEQDKPFGLIVDDITGGFTLTGRVTPNSFNVRPVSVWRVYADGRPDELVRGGDFIGTPLTTFSRILAAGDDPEVFNGVCGAESGWVPVSAVSPSLLLEEIEVQRKEKENDRPPLLPAPPSPQGDTKSVAQATQEPA